MKEDDGAYEFYNDYVSEDEMDAIYDEESKKYEAEYEGIQKYKSYVASNFILPANSELRKKWKDMIPLLAIEEAKDLPLPVRRELTEEYIDWLIVDYKGYEKGTPEYNNMLSHLNRPFVKPLTDQEKLDGITRCPCCRSGKVKKNTCPCCSGFIFVHENRIIDFLSGLNEMTEEEKILKQTKKIIKDKKSKRKEKKNSKEVKNKKGEENTIDLFGVDDNTKKKHAEDIKSAVKNSKKQHA